MIRVFRALETAICSTSKEALPAVLLGDVAFWTGWQLATYGISASDHVPKAPRPFRRTNVCGHVINHVYCTSYSNSGVCT